MKKISYDDAVKFHGHSCPGLALGYRVSIRALKELGGRSVDEELVAIVENNSCAVDAVQIITGCTFGKGNFIFRDYGKQVYTFISRRTGKSVRIAVDWKQPEETAQDKALWAKYAKGERTKKVLQFVHDAKSRKTKHILETKDADLMKVEKGKDALPPQASIYKSLTCAACSERVMEPRARVRDEKIVCIPCFEKEGTWKK